MAPIRQVRDEDGALEPFRERRIADSIDAALSAAGRPERALAEELAAVVTLFLAKRFDALIPTIPEVQDMVETVLVDTGQVAAAKSFRAARDQREGLRNLLTVRSTSTPRPDDIVLPHDLGSGDTVTRWSRSHVTRMLIDDVELPGPMAEELALSIERRVFAAGFRCVTQDFVGRMLTVGLDCIQDAT